MKGDNPWPQMTPSFYFLPKSPRTLGTIIYPVMFGLACCWAPQEIIGLLSAWGDINNSVKLSPRPSEEGIERFDRHLLSNTEHNFWSRPLCRENFVLEKIPLKRPLPLKQIKTSTATSKSTMVPCVHRQNARELVTSIRQMYKNNCFPNFFMIKDMNSS